LQVNNVDRSQLTFNFSAEYHEDGVAVEADIPNNPLMHSPIVDTSFNVSDKYDGAFCSGFHGVKSLTEESQFSELAGVTIEVFKYLLALLPLDVDDVKQKMSQSDRLLLFLMKMKLGLSYSALGVLFGIHQTTASRTFISFLKNLFEKTQNYIIWPSKSTIKNNLPQSFRLNYPNTRVIIDCTEISTEQPDIIEQRSHMYSFYKGCYTFKFLIGITPGGLISFKSKCYGGGSSDTFITNDCNIASLLEFGDVVLAVRGFPGIETTTPNTIIIIPPFVHDGHLPEEKIEETESIANVRIHVEQSIQRLKMYKILDKVTVDLFPHIDQIVHFCCVLANLQPPIHKAQHKLGVP